MISCLQQKKGLNIKRETETCARDALYDFLFHVYDVMSIIDLQVIILIKIVSGLV